MSPAAHPSTPRCGAKTRSGGHCTQVAGWGTDHFGFGACRFHAGNTPAGRMAGATAMAEAHAASLVGVSPMEPHEALEWLIGRERAMLEFYDRRIGELHPDDVQGSVVTTRPLKEEKGAENPTQRVEEHGPPAAHIWIKLRDAAAERLARFAKLAADVNVGERRVRIEEARLDAIAAVLNAVMRELRAAGLSDELHRLAGDSFRRHAAQLNVVNGTAREVAA